MSKSNGHTGGTAAVDALRDEGVSVLFGLIGSAAMELFDALYHATDIRFIGVHDERSGVHMADGYARASGRAGVMLAGQNGPGATNLVTGVAQARAAYSPVVSLAGAISSAHLYRDGFQEVDQQSLFAPLTKKTYTVPSAPRVYEIVREAVRTAQTPRCGPVHVNFPRDVLSQVIQPSPRVGVGGAVAMPAGDASAVKRAAALLAAAQRAVIIAGGGLKHEVGAGAVLALAQRLGTPVVTSPGHGDVLPHDHPLHVGQMGPRGNEVASRLVREADVIVALGTRLGFNSTFYSYEHMSDSAAIIQVEIEPAAIGRFFPVEVGIWGDAASVAYQISAELERVQASEAARAWGEAAQRQRLAFLHERDTSAPMGTPIQPAGVFRVLRELAPKNAAYTLDAGTLCLQATDALPYSSAPSLFTPLDFGLVGFSYACGLGVKLALPQHSVISLMGDGGFGMTASELSTAVDNDIATVTVVMNNGCWGAEKAYQRDFFGERYIGADVSSPRFDKLAELYGAVGFRAETLSQFGDALRAAVESNKPAVIDLMMDPGALYSFRRDSFAHRLG